MKQYSRVYAKVDLDAIVNNLDQMKRNLDKNTGIMAVVKTDGYGHGAVPVARKIHDIPYVKGFAVATAEEALSLRRHQITKPILILGAVFEYQLEDVIREEIRMNIFQLSLAEKIQKTAEKLRKTAYLHVKLDTSMNRLGIRPDEAESVSIVETIANFANIQLEGIYTHFSKADEKDKAASYKQLQLFQDFVEVLNKKNITFPIKHCSNSAGIIDLKEANLDMVRAGISLYGLYPSNEVQKQNVLLKPAMSLHSCIVYIKDVKEGLPVSYGGTYITTKQTKIATVPVGYGDGYPRLLSNRGRVLIRGISAPIIGRICMDQLMVDVTHIPDVQEGEEVVLFGESCGEQLSIEELSSLCGRFNYEFLCNLGKRIPRVYVSNGEVIGTKDWFAE